MTRIGIIGSKGRVGRLLVQEINSGEWPDLTLAGGTVRSGAAHTGDFFITEDADKLLERADAVIDFTKPEVTARTALLAASHKIPYITGTTGLNTAQEQELRAAAKDIPVVYAANMSVGVTLLAALVEQAAAKLGPDWDIEILETHHKHKVDAPSGTALMLGKAAAKLHEEERFVTERGGKRAPGTIGFASRRGGDVVGEHTVGFYGAGERLELSHIATDRRLFARGALKAALWAVRQKPGLYSMRDVLGL